MKVAVFIALILMVPAPSEASKSCMGYRSAPTFRIGAHLLAWCRLLLGCFAGASARHITHTVAIKT